MRIAVCDDDKQDLLQIAALLEQYKRENNAELYHTEFISASELITVMHVQEFDLLLLDMLMPGLSGIQAAKEIRGFNESVKIVFLTSTPEFAVESYRVQALSYLLKPPTREQLFPILGRLFAECQRPQEALPIRTRSRVFALPYSRIEYVEIIAKTLYFHLSDGSREEVSGALSEYEPALLARPGFAKVHRSYIVNLQHIQSLDAKCLHTYAGGTVPISRLLYSEVREAYMEHLFREKEVQ